MPDGEEHDGHPVNIPHIPGQEEYTATVPAPPGKLTRIEVRARNAAGLGPPAVSEPIVADPFAGRWLALGKELAQQDQRAAAIVMLQTAAEIFTEQVVTELLTESSVVDAVADYIHSTIPNYNLARDGRLLKLYKALSGDDAITAATGSWHAYTEHVKLRNKVAHRGAQVSAQDMANSIAAVEWLLRHLHAAAGARFSLWLPTEPLPPGTITAP